MSEKDSGSKLRMGFLSALEVEGRGFVGGLLVTTQHGRPLEFQCTTPVRPDRTQEILFGDTLRPWVLGELIGSTLIQRIGIKPTLLITGDPDLLELRNHTKIPVAWAVDFNKPLDEDRQEGTDGSDAVTAASTFGGKYAAVGHSFSHRHRLDSGHGGESRTLRVGHSTLRFHPAHPLDHDDFRNQVKDIPESADLAEPLYRVREALEETVKSVLGR